MIKANDSLENSTLINSEAKMSNKINVNEVSLLDKVGIGIGEFLATTIMVFVACMGCVTGIRDEYVLLQQMAFSSGLAVMIAIFLFGHITGAHVNILTSIGAVIVGKIPLVLLPIYFVAQLFGAISGYGLLILVTPEPFMQLKNATTHGTCVNMPNPQIFTWQAVMVELLLSLILTLANCSSWHYKNKNNLDSMPLKFGFLMCALTMVGGAYTGASLNPTKSFAAALWNNYWENHWIYWVSPITASILGSFLYKIIYLRPNKDQSATYDS